MLLKNDVKKRKNLLLKGTDSVCLTWILFRVSILNQRLSMELDLQSLFGLQCVRLYSLANTPQLPPSPCIWARIRGRYWSAKIDDISL